MKLYFVRHAQTDWNVERRIQGQTDIPLNATGIAQAEALRDYIRQCGLHFIAIYTAPLQRTAQTAQILAASTDKIIYDPRISERQFGEFEGKPCGTVLNHEIDFLDLELNAGGFGVEPVLDFQGRIQDFLSDIKRHYPPDATILCVTSNGVMKRLAKLVGYTGCKMPDFQNGKIYEFEL